MVAISSLGFLTQIRLGISMPSLFMFKLILCPDWLRGSILLSHATYLTTESWNLFVTWQRKSLEKGIPQHGSRLNWYILVAEKWPAMLFAFCYTECFLIFHYGKENTIMRCHIFFKIVERDLLSIDILLAINLYIRV